MAIDNNEHASLSMILLVDNYDSFTYNLLNYCRQFYSDCDLIRNDECDLNEISSINPDAFIFSPGPGRPDEHPLMYEIVKNFKATKPILGICLGFQAIGAYFGAEVIKNPTPVHGKVSAITHSGHATFKGIPSPFNVTRYHSLSLGKTDQMENVSITAFTRDEKIPMALAHHHLPLVGFQFHPEAILTDYGLTLIQNWLNRHFNCARI